VFSLRDGSGSKGRPPRTAEPNNRTDNVAVPASKISILNVVAPRKQVFVLRLSSDTTCESVAAYISKKVSPNVSITKFNFDFSREIESFKIGVPYHSFTIICYPKFWPPPMIVNEFKSKRRSESLPVSLSGAR